MFTRFWNRRGKKDRNSLKKWWRMTVGTFQIFVYHMEKKTLPQKTTPLPGTRKTYGSPPQA